MGRGNNPGSDGLMGGRRGDEGVSATDVFGPVISAYSRAQAIEDGFLVDIDDVSPTMRAEAGIKYPVALTDSVWHDLIVPDEERKSWGQSVEGRLWDTLWMFSLAARKADGDQIDFEVYYLMNDDSTLADGEPQAKPVKLKAICHPGDTPEPVITISYPHED